MRVVSVDLAYKDYEDIGVAVMEADPTGARYELVNLACGSRKPEPAFLAHKLVDICRQNASTILMLDGPQAWKSPSNGLDHSRLCERALNTPAKTGLPSCAKPANYLAFITFAIQVFDELHQLGWHRFDPKGWSPATPTTIESFPLSAWRSLTLRSLPAKSKATEADLHRGIEALIGVQLLASGMTFPTHDQLQALVAGVAGLDLAANGGCHISAGVAPFQLDGTWREGYIVTPGVRQITSMPRSS